MPVVAGASGCQTGAMIDPQSVQPVLAYIDPGTGSFLVQALVAAIAGIAVTSRMYWHKIRGFLGLASDSDEDGESPRDDD